MSDLERPHHDERGAVPDGVPAEQEYMPTEFLDADPNLIPGDHAPPAETEQSVQAGRNAPLPKAPVPPTVEKVERKTSTLDNWEGEGGATLTGPVPEKMPENPETGGTNQATV